MNIRSLFTLTVVTFGIVMGRRRNAPRPVNSECALPDYSLLNLDHIRFISTSTFNDMGG